MQSLSAASFFCVGWRRFAAENFVERGTSSKKHPLCYVDSKISRLCFTFSAAYRYCLADLANRRLFYGYSVPYSGLTDGQLNVFIRGKSLALCLGEHLRLFPNATQDVQNVMFPIVAVFLFPYRRTQRADWHQTRPRVCFLACCNSSDTRETKRERRIAPALPCSTGAELSPRVVPTFTCSSWKNAPSARRVLSRLLRCVLHTCEGTVDDTSARPVHVELIYTAFVIILTRVVFDFGPIHLCPSPTHIFVASFFGEQGRICNSYPESRP